MKKTISLLLILTMAFTACFNCYALDINDKYSTVYDILSKYNISRVNSLIGVVSDECSTSNRNLLENEAERKEKVLKMEERLNIKITGAEVTLNIQNIDCLNNKIQVSLYEWTYFNYLDLDWNDGIINTSGFGTEHSLMIGPDENDVYLIEGDVYDEGTLTGMCVTQDSSRLDTVSRGFRTSSSTIINPQNSEKLKSQVFGQKTSSYVGDSNLNADTLNLSDTGLADSDLNCAELPIEVTCVNSTKELESVESIEITSAQPLYTLTDCSPTTPTRTYNRDSVTFYADKYAMSYNASYVNFIDQDSDCANFVSQCMNMGGAVQTGKQNNNIYSSDVWFYNFKYTNSVSDDSYSTAWTYVPHHIVYFSRHGTRIDNPSALQIKKGNPVYYNWDNSGGYDHVTICVGTNTSGTPVVDSHTNPYYRMKWNYGGSSCTYGTILIKNDWTNG